VLLTPRWLMEDVAEKLNELALGSQMNEKKI